ncbi:MAG TPA: histidine kinase [Thermoanaerobaculia bacterium]|nr:histidine kinase [Thermoanaerobaculia bacterium]
MKISSFLAMLLFATTASAWDGPRMRVGHDPAWASPQLDDSSWTPVDLNDVPQPNDSVWLRWTIDLTEFERKPGRPFGIYFAALASHEIWWDGELIGRGGVVGRTRETETPGPVEAHYQVPDRLVTPAVHTVAIRASAFHRGFSPRHGYWTLIAGNYDRILERRTGSAHLALIALSGILLTKVFAFSMFWLTRRDRSFLLLGTLCLAAAALLAAEAWRPLWGYTYDWHLVRLLAIVALSWLTGVQLVALVVTRFPHRIGKWALAATGVICLAAPFIPRGWDQKAVIVFFISFGVATLWTAWAALRRLNGSVLALIGVGGATLALAVRPWQWLDNVVYFALLFLFVCLLCSHALEVRREQHLKARLELEMLRRHLQPHFLMNTLTALSEWIESDPKAAVRMIESLADELRILATMANHSLVPAEDELRLCRTHLANMSMRKDVAYELEVDGVDGRQLVPPAVFHTLVENAITHGTPSPRSVTFRLSARAAGHRIRYTFEAPAPDEDPPVTRGGGTRYIEARLREAWGEAWSFRQHRAGTTWRAEIEVPA